MGQNWRRNVGGNGGVGVGEGVGAVEAMVFSGYWTVNNMLDANEEV